MSRIIDVAQAGGLRLRKRGREFVALCCFHEERTPSMSINPDIDAFHCFGCGASGGYVALAERLAIELDVVLGPRANQPISWSPPVPVKRVPAELVDVVMSLPSVTSDTESLLYIERRRWRPAYEAGLLLFPSAGKPVIDTKRGPSSIWSLGFRVGCALLDLTGAVAGAQFRKLGSAHKYRFTTFGSGSFGDRSRVQGASRVVVAEGLSDYLVLVDQCGGSTDVVLGVPGVASAARLLAECPWEAGTEVVIAFDRDDAGERAAHQVATLLVQRGCRPMRGWAKETTNV